MNPSKSQRIDLWRQEVALAATDTTSAQASAPASQQQRRSSQASFFSKLLRYKSNEFTNREEELETTAMYQVTQDGEEARKGNEARDAGKKCRDEDESMVIADLSTSTSSRGGLVAKRERLERAARLLGKDGGREDKG